MNDLNSQRYQFITKIKTYSQGKLFHGKDLSLHRNVLLYQLKTNLSAEESLGLIRRVNGFNHPNFLHILDIGHSDQGVLAVLELRNGSILSEIIESSDYSFQKCLEMTIEVGKMVEMALEQGIRGFSISTDNLWLTDEQTLMGINYWATGEEKFRGALGLFHFLYQLLSKSIEIPDFLRKLRKTYIPLNMLARYPTTKQLFLMDCFKRPMLHLAVHCPLSCCFPSSCIVRLNKN